MLLATGGSPVFGAVQDDILQAVKDGKTEFRLPKGIVKIDRTLELRGLRNFTLDGTGTTLVCTDWHRFALAFNDCANVTLRGLTIDYDPLPFTQGTVTARADDGSWLEIAIHDGFPDLSDDLLHGQVRAFLPDALRWRPDAPDLYSKKAVAIDARHARLELHRNAGVENVRVGDRIALNFTGAGGIKFAQCENVTVEGVNVLAAPGIALICRYMKGENRFSFDIHPGPKPAGATQSRLMSSCADGFNYACARRGPVLENSHFSFMGDDSVNLHGATFIVAAQPSDREIIAGWQWTKESLPWLLQPGDTVRRLKAGNFAIAGEAALEAFEPIEKPDPAWKALITAKGWPKATDIRGIFRFKLREPLHVEPGDAIDIPECNSPGFRIANNEFRDHRARGVRVMSSHGVIENNLFERLKMCAITLGPEYGYWREAGWLDDVIVRNNRIVDCMLSPSQEPEAAGVISVIGHIDAYAPFKAGEHANRRITLENNSQRGCGGMPLQIEYVSDLLVK